MQESDLAFNWKLPHFSYKQLCGKSNGIINLPEGRIVCKIGWFLRSDESWGAPIYPLRRLLPLKQAVSALIPEETVPPSLLIAAEREPQGALHQRRVLGAEEGDDLPRGPPSLQLPLHLPQRGRFLLVLPG